MKVRLAYWWNGYKPGDVVDIDARTCRRLQRNGRIAEIVAEEPAPSPGPERRSPRTRNRRVPEATDEAAGDADA